ILSRVRMENISERGRDHTAKAVVGKCPGGVLARRTTAKVFACHQNFGALVVWMIQHEIRVRRAGVRPFLNAPPIEKEEVTIAGAFNPLEELLGNDLVGVDVLAIEGCDYRC